MADRVQYYTLDANDQPHECTAYAWLAWVESGRRTKRITTIGSENIETACPGFRNGNELLWHTRVYGLRCAGMAADYETYDEAMAGHEEMVARVREELARG